jgi:cytidyltransferase-like protein
MKQSIYHLIAIAGTFDRLHKGHRFFISQAFNLGKKVIIGLTSDEYVEKKLSVVSYQLSVGNKKRLKTPRGWQAEHSEAMTPPMVERAVKLEIQNYQERKKALEEFLAQNNLLDQAEIVKIDDVYGPATKGNEIEALVVTRETMEGGRLVNRKRNELGLKPLKLVQVSLVKAEDQKKIASTRIRIGEIDRYGKVLERLLPHGKISERTRQQLKKPIGELFRGNSDDLAQIANDLKKRLAEIQPVMISTIGDEVTKLCNQVGIPINLAIFDYKVRRKEKYHSLAELGFSSINSKTIKTPARWPNGLLAGGGVRETSEMEKLVTKVSNPPGNITNDLIGVVKSAYEGIITDGKQKVIKVAGEDDLAGVPAILLSPLDSIVLYGQPGEGVVVVKVTEEKKEQLLKIMNRNK